MNRNEFLSLHQELLSMEKESEIEATKIVVGEGSERYLERKGKFLKKLLITEWKTENYGYQCIVLQPMPNVKSIPSNSFTTGDIVGLYQLNPEKGCCELKDRGIIKFISSQKIKIALHESDLSKLENDRYVRLHKLANDVSYRRMQHAVNVVQTDEPSRTNHLFSVMFEESSPMDMAPRLPPQILNHNNEIKLFNVNLNTSQVEAVDFVLRRPDIAVVHGPPGTGKTTVMVEVIQQHVALGDKVLVCAPSNIAVDNLVERLAKRKVKVVRIGNPIRATSVIQDYTLDALVYRNGHEVLSEIRKDIDKCREKWRTDRSMGKYVAKQELNNYVKELRIREDKIIKEVLSTSDVILSTLTAASNEGPLHHLKADHFSVTIIDECSQAIEAGCYIPAIRAPKLVLAGDHKQLPPTVISHEAARRGLELSLMERLSNQNEDIFKMLTIQYRMNDLIMNWSSNAMYNGNLKADQSVANHTLADFNNITLTEETSPVLLLIDTAGCNYDEMTVEETSKFNVNEAILVNLHIDKLIQSGMMETDIAVIAPYSKQVEVIQSMLSEKYPRLEVRTVDGFQGREKEAVVMSLVRSNDERNVGFLKEGRRLNVAVTRAKRHLTVIGDSITVSNDPFFKEFFEYLNDNAMIRSAYEFDKEILAADFQLPPICVLEIEEHQTRVARNQKNKSKKKEKSSSNKENLNVTSVNKTYGNNSGDSNDTEPITSPNFEENNFIIEEYKIVIKDFIRSKNTSYLFPTHLDSRERRIIHDLAESYNLLHYSSGSGNERFITVQKPEVKKPIKKRVRQEGDSIDIDEESPNKRSPSPENNVLINSPVNNSFQELATLKDNQEYFFEEAIPDNSPDRTSIQLKLPSNKDNQNSNESNIACTPLKDDQEMSDLSESTENLSPHQLRTCFMCKEEVPFVTFRQHRDKTCPRRGEFVKNKSENVKKKKKTKVSKSMSKVESLLESKTASSDIDQLIDKLSKLEKECSFKTCKSRVNIEELRETCQFCSKLHCLPHAMPEIHGCGDKKRDHERAMAYKNVPSTSKTSASKRAQLKNKLDKKLENLSLDRKTKPKKKK